MTHMGVMSGVGDGVFVDVARACVELGVAVLVTLAVAVKDEVDAGVLLVVGVSVGARVRVTLAVGEAVRDGLGVKDAVGDGIRVGVFVSVLLDVGVDVGVGGLHFPPEPALKRS